MVRSSYKKRPKNRKQSFKRRNTGGQRIVRFIEDNEIEMVGGDDDDKIAITNFLNKYKTHPMFGILIGIYSNQKCANVDPITQECRDDNTAQLETSYKKSVEIMNSLPKFDDKPVELIDDEQKNKSQKLNYVKTVIDCLAQNVFIPNKFIHNVHVENNDASKWTTLTNTNFKKTDSTEDTKERTVKTQGITPGAVEAQGSDDGAYKPTEKQKQQQASINTEIENSPPNLKTAVAISTQPSRMGINPGPLPYNKPITL